MSSPSNWREVARESNLNGAELLTVKLDDHQLVVGRGEQSEIFALDNRCPHEGYPLASGDLKGCELTCAWHNWKFKVTDGSCVLGGEGVRSYPVRIRNGGIEVDLADPDPEELRDKLMASIEEGMFRFDNGRVFRDVARLLQTGYSAERLAADVVAYDANHAEYGSTHTLAVAADGLRLIDRYPGTDALYALAPALDICGETNQRMPTRELSDPIEYPVDQVGDELRRAVEGEDGARAEGLLRGAFRAGVSRQEIEAWLFAALSDHFLNFGHPLIYLIKSQELMERAGDERAEEILAGQLYGFVLSTREDTLPYMKAYSDRLKSIEAELPELWSGADGRTPVDAGAVRDAVLDGSSGEAFDVVLGALRAGAAPTELARALVGAAAHRFLRFDDELDRSPDVVESWLWATHRFTFASAVRNAVERFHSPDALRFLFQAVAFIHSGRGMDLKVAERQVIEPESATLNEVLAAIWSRQSAVAVNRVAGYLQSGASLRELRETMEDLCLADPVVRPIVVAHVLKTTVAAWEEFDALDGHVDQATSLLATVRLLASPIVERRVHELAGRSLQWVVNGVMPKKLTQ